MKVSIGNTLNEPHNVSSRRDDDNDDVDVGISFVILFIYDKEFNLPKVY